MLLVYGAFVGGITATPMHRYTDTIRKRGGYYWWYPPNVLFPLAVPYVLHTISMKLFDGTPRTRHPACLEIFGHIGTVIVPRRISLVHLNRNIYQQIRDMHNEALLIYGYVLEDTSTTIIQLDTE